MSREPVIQVHENVLRKRAHGQASDILIAAKEIEKTRHELISIISKHSGMSYDKVFSDADRDFWMSAEEAKSYGMVDDILIKKAKKLD